jgi:hypothetical protein
MNWRFTLIDRNGDEFIFDEPVGWDAAEFKVQRDPEGKHGIFFDFQNNDLEYRDEAYKMIKAEYEEYGIQGDMTIVIEEECNGDYEELYRGKVQFSDYKPECGGGDCVVKIPLETTSDLMTFRNRLDQKVDLLSTTAFDKTTVLPAYDKLGFDLELPSKGILLQNKAENDAVNATNCDIETDLILGYIEIGMKKTIAGEIGGFFFEPQPKYTMFTDVPPGWDVNFDLYSPIVNYSQEFGSAVKEVGSTPIETEYLIAGRVAAINTTISQLTLGFYKRDKDDNFTVLDGMVWIVPPSTGAPITPGNHFDFSRSYSDNLVLNEGDRLYLLIGCHPDEAIPHAQIADAFNISFDAGNYFRMNVISHTAASDTKAFMINEAISRVAEAITNDKIRAFSSYYGRTDSQPYSHASDGCGSLRGIAKGLFIRRQESRNGAAAMNVSMNDLWEGLEPIDHIGYGLEADPARPGYQRLRIENWKHFYSDEIVLECYNVARISKKVIEKEHYSTFSFGYQRWEAEEYNGLDEFLTKRVYRTTLSEIKNELSKLSKFIGSGYAIEITRRKKSDDSKDWRYDNENFIICLERHDGVSVRVELGNVTNDENIIDPDTLYNYRISPIRNALRWMDKILSTYRKMTPDSKIIFTDGDGNYQAKGIMTSTTCRWELNEIRENDDINIAVFAEAAKAKPILRPERDSFEYPMSVKEFKAVKAKPYGKIYYENEDCGPNQGWIDTINYKPEQGIAEFVIIPDLNFSASGSTSGRPGLLTESGFNITTEDGQNITTE